MSSNTDNTQDFPGTDRFEVKHRLGAGGMGVVYECVDRSSGQRVALKTLTLPDPTSIYRFKNEFRGLADITHPNLISLHELLRAEDHWFFTMELVRGKNFMAHVRNAGTSPDVDVHAGTEAAMSGEDFGGATLPSSARLASAPDDMVRLRDALRQLAEGVHALHRAGKLHRDIKPSNIIVENSGRVVLLDFGLATDFGGSHDSLTDASLVGTALYMAPEQARREKLGPASDWYAVGTVLYEALTGTLPFSGRGVHVLMQKQEDDPTPPQELLPDLPGDLCELCTRLMSRAAEARPRGPEVLHALGATTPGVEIAAGSMASEQGRIFVGRGEELEALRVAFEQVWAESEPRVVLVHGVAGIGKSAVLRQFGEYLSHEREAVVLSGRCYEWESVPLKAVDTIIDALSRHLRGLDQNQCRQLLPPGTQALARLFPVLNAVPTIAAVRDDLQVPDPHEARRRGLDALRLLLHNVAATRPLMLRVDDFQWGDAESALLLADLMSGPTPPPLLLCIAYRDPRGKASEALLGLERRLHDKDAARRLSRIEVGPLELEEVRELARIRLGAAGHSDRDSYSGRVARESAGSPLFVEEMIRYLQSSASGTPEMLGDLSLEQAILARVDLLSANQRYLLELVAVAGAPITEALAVRACPGENTEASISVLRAGHLIRRNREGTAPKLQTFHDRIRQSLSSLLSDTERQERYLALATALQGLAPAESEDLALYFSRAGEHERASAHATKAAQTAADALVFERAALFYRMALEATHPPERARQLRIKMAAALANSGRGAQAAPEYLRAAEGASAAMALDLRRRAAEQYLRTGHIQAGRALLEEVLQSVKLPLHNSKGALLSLLLQRSLLRLRGLAYKARDASQISAEDLQKVDVCWSSAVGFGLTDPIRGANFQTRHLRLALRSGEPYRISRALALECCYLAIDGAKSHERALQLMETAKELGKTSQNPHATGIAEFSKGQAYYQIGRWRAAFEQFEASSRVFREECEGEESDATQSLRFGIDALFNLGEMAELAKRVPEYLSQAQQRGDLHGSTDMRTGLPNSVWLVTDEPERAREECRQAAAHWRGLDFFLQHYYEGLALTHIELYEEEGGRALARVDAMWPKLERSLLLRVQAVRVEALFLLGRSLVAAAVEHGACGRQQYLGRLASLGKKLRRERTPAAVPYADLLLSQAALLAAQPDRSISLLRQARSAFEAADMTFGIATCDTLLTGMLEASEAARHSELARSWMQANAVVDPARFVGMMAPARP